MPTLLEIVTPEKLLMSRDVDMVVVPAAEGELGVLPQHAPMIALLRGGVVRVYEGGNVTDQLFVTGGFVDVTPERCTVLATTVTKVADLNGAETDRLMTEAQSAYDEADKMDMAAVDAAMTRLQVAHAMKQATSAG